MRTDVAIEDLEKMIEVLKQEDTNPTLLRMTEIASTCWLIVETHVQVMKTAAAYPEEQSRELIKSLTQRHAP